jgi:Na+-translocating ferredoxin:NAD+ oxidoreductase RNF subunit RnfB
MRGSELEFDEIRNKLAGLDCSDCGYGSCDDMASAILKGKATLDDCLALKAGKKVVLKVGGNDVPMRAFVQEFVKNTVIGMAKSLKKVELKAGDTIELKIVVDEDDI